MTPYFIGLAVAVAAIAMLVAFFFQYQLSTLRLKEDSLRKTAEEASATAQRVQKELDGGKEELVRRRSEASDLREKLADMRSRQHKQRESERRTKGGAEAELKEELEIAQRQLDDERSRVDVLSRESQGMQGELAKLRDSHRKLEETVKSATAAAARAASIAVAAPAPAATASTPAEPGAVAAAPKVDEAQKRLELLDRQVKEARRKGTELEEEVKRSRSKASTATRNHLLVKSELDLFKEKLVWSEKRVVELERLLFDNKISLPEREVAPQPKAPQLAPGILARESANTGGEGVVTESADYVPEEAPGSQAVTSASTPEAPAQVPGTEGSPSAPSEASAAAPAEAAPVLRPPAETAPAPEMESGEPRPMAVPPIRRPRATVEGEEIAAKPE